MFSLTRQMGLLGRLFLAAGTGAQGAPVNAAAPSITGTGYMGDAHTAGAGTWTGALWTARIWIDGNGQLIPHAVGSSFTPYLSEGLRGGIKVREYAGNASGVAYADSPLQSLTFDTAKAYIIQFAGQSNMTCAGSDQGSGGAATAPSNIKGQSLKIWAPTSIAGGSWQSYNPGTNSAYIGSASTLWGPEGELCREVLAAFPGIDLRIMKYAVGSTYLDSYGLGVNGNVWDPTVANNLWSNFKAHNANAIAAVQAEPKTPILCDTIWNQGEADSNTLAPANSYASNFAAFIAACRGALGTGWGSRRFVVMRIFAATGAYQTTVRAAETGAAATDPLIDWYDADGCLTAGDYNAPHAGPLGISNVMAPNAFAKLKTPGPHIYCAGELLENLGAGVNIGVVGVANDTGWSVSISSDASGCFAISGGNLVSTSTPANYEATSSITIQLTATKSGQTSLVQSFTIPVVNVNEAPTNIGLSNASVAADAQVGDTIGAFTATDPDVGDTFTWALTNNDSGNFAVSGNSLKVAASLASLVGTRTITAQVTDSGGLTYSKSFTITVTAASGSALAAILLSMAA